MSKGTFTSQMVVEKEKEEARVRAAVVCVGAVGGGMCAGVASLVIIIITIVIVITIIMI